MSIAVHPSFFAAAAVLLLTGNAAALPAALAVVLVHELFHARQAYERGYALKKISLTPYGAVISGEEIFSERDAVAIAAAGPLSNAVICLVLYALWWRFPAAYPYTKTIFDVSFAIGAFNLLPFYPLDGGRIILGISKNKLRALKGLKAAGVIGSFLMIVWFVVSAFFTVNPTPAVMAVPLYLGAVGGTEKERYRYLYECISESKLKKSPLEVKTVTVHWGLRLKTLLRRIEKKSLTNFIVLNDGLEEVTRLTENEFLKLLTVKPLSATVKESLEF